MSTVLVLNSGSSSLKYRLVDVEAGRPLAEGVVQRIGEEESTFSHTGAPGWAAGEGHRVADHAEALEFAAAAFAEHGPDLEQAGLTAIGHRVVHGGDRSEPAVITPEVLAEIEELQVLAPLHNRAAATGIRAAQALHPELPHVAVFDTAFFACLPAASRTYAIDRQVAREHRIRRYGFHGTSHDFVSARAAELVGRPRSELRQVVLHLGNGASVSAVDGDRPVDTSMGLTPLEGLVMGTRSGDLDPAVLLTLARAGWTTEDLDTLLNRRSGLLGLSGVNDFRELTRRLAAGDPDARLAHDVYLHRLVRYVGGYHALLGGADLLVFTAGVGENNPALRAALVDRLRPLGFVLDAEANAAPAQGPRVVSAPGSPVTVAVVPTDEELAIARQTVAVLR
ncbi:acetate/propionate family kinase [Auraticoccus sp. F435]|uniref:Acetate kinase n=1 Tax=Auraticoccus cholistanensis TaxID=2656650 RepID=A0A6A9V036_9ACTN|nr:acetate kinase [Auraticoccus cholistanensis]MVA74730.1 acetate/propionate family kinase [Auraticoccus cholistanensis]